jgi:hypothetical protein
MVSVAPPPVEAEGAIPMAIVEPETISATMDAIIAFLSRELIAASRGPVWKINTSHLRATMAMA